MRRSDVTGVTGVWTRPNIASPAMRLGVEDAEVLELGADIGLALGRGGRQRGARRADRAAHDHHAALERRRVLVFEQVPQAGHLVLQLSRARPLARDAGIEQRSA